MKNITITPTFLKRVFTDYPIEGQKDPHHENNYTLCVTSDGEIFPHVAPLIERCTAITQSTGNETHFRLFIPFDAERNPTHPGIAYHNLGSKESVPTAKFRGITTEELHLPILHLHTHPIPKDIPYPAFSYLPSYYKENGKGLGDLTEATERYRQYGNGGGNFLDLFTNPEINIVVFEQSLFFYQLLTPHSQNLIHFLDNYGRYALDILDCLAQKERATQFPRLFAEKMEQSGAFKAHHTTSSRLTEDLDTICEKFSYEIKIEK